MLQVLIADDHAVVRRGLKEILAGAQRASTCGEASSATEVLARLDEGRWDALILDLTLPGAHGLDLLSEVRRRRPRLPVLVLTAHSEEEYAVRALLAGASGFLTKESAPEELLRALGKIVAGGRYVGPSLAERLADRLGKEETRPAHESLSDREFDVLKRIASGRTVSEIASDLELSVKTVSTYRSRILEKMGMRTNAQLTHYAIRTGLVAQE